VPPGTPAGVYSISYQVCEKLNPTNCKTTTASITVDPAPIVAADDAVTGVNGATGNPSALNVLTNDTVNSNPATLGVTGNAAISVTAPATSVPGALAGSAVPVLNTATGLVNIPAGTPAGVYVITYQLCEKLNPANCKTAIASVTVDPSSIVATNDTITGINGATGNATAGNVLPNDAVNGAPATVGAAGNAVLSLVSPATSLAGAPAGSPVPVFAPATGNVAVPAGTPAGNYVITYQLCEKLNPTNCKTATETVTVIAATIAATPDSYTVANGATGNPSAGNVLSNDTVNGGSATVGATGTSTLSVTTPATSVPGAPVGSPVPTLDTSTGVIIVPVGTPAGIYTISYQLCEKLNPSNCKTTTATVTVGAATLVATNDAYAGINGLAGNPNMGNVLVNDTLNGVPATVGATGNTVVSIITAAVPVAGAPAGSAVAVLDPATGTVSVPAGTRAGSYVITYQLCEKLNSNNCKTATVTANVIVTITAVVDPAGSLSAADIPATGGITTTPVTANDSTNSTPVVITGASPNASLTVGVIASPPATGSITLNPATGLITVAPGTTLGIYSVPYTICTLPATTPATCSTTTATVVVGSVINPVLETGTSVAGTAATPIANIRANDFVNGVAATAVNSTIALDATSPALPTGMVLNTTTGAITTTAATPPGVYSIKYKLCDLASPTPNCASVTDTVTVTASPLLTVTKTASQSPLAVGKLGQFYTITITVANGPTTAPITLVDVMPAGVTLSAMPTATGGMMSSCPATGSSLAGCTIAANVSGSVVVSVPVLVGAAAAGKPAVNSATVSGGGDPSCPAAAHCTGTDTSSVVSPDMQVAPITSLPPAVKGVPYPPNQTVSCVNVSAVDAANAFCTITDLPPGLISTCTPASPVALLPAGEKIVCTISGTPTGTVSIKAKVTTGADGDLVNTNNDGVLISKAASLVVAKTVSANPLIIGAPNQYYSISIAVTDGPTTEPITLVDNFGTGITTSGPVIISGGAFKAGTCSAASSAGASTLSGCQIDAGVADTVYIKVPILVDDVAEGPSGGNNTITASGGGDPACPVSTNCVGSTGTVAVIYGDLGALFIRKVADRAAAEIGDVITYKVTVRSTKVKGNASIEDHLPLGLRLIGNTTRVSKNGVLTAVADPAGAPGPKLVFNIQIPAIDQDVEIEYKVRVGLGADRGDGINSAQASMVRGRLRSLIAKAKVKITGGVFTREACIVGKVYADCNGNAVQDKGELGIPNVTLYLEDGTSMTTDENGQYSICGVRAVTHVLKIDNKTLPRGAKLGITSNRNAGDPNTLFVDVLAGQLHNTEFRLDSCTPEILQNIEMRQKGQTGSNAVIPKSGGVQFDSTKPKISGSGFAQPATQAVDAGVKP
jgi:large repetitive protein